VSIAARWPDGKAAIGDLPAAGTFTVAIPDRQPGARLVGDPALGRLRIQTMNLAQVTVAVARGDGTVIKRDVASPTLRNQPVEIALAGDDLLLPGANRLALTWAGGSAEQDVIVHHLPAPPVDLGGALLRGHLPVVAPR
jgi:hypothetical protein